MIGQLDSRDRPSGGSMPDAGLAADGDVHHALCQIIGPNHRAILVMNDGDRKILPDAIAQPVPMTRAAVGRWTNRQADAEHQRAGPAENHRFSLHTGPAVNTNWTGR